MRLAAIFGLALCGWSFAPHARAEPACAATCRDLSARGQLASGVTPAACEVRVCQEDGRKLYEKGDYAGSIAAYDHVAEASAGSPAFQMDRGLTLYALGRFDEAIACFDRVILIFPKGVRAAAQRGHALVRLGRFDEAIAQFRALIDTPGVEASYRDLRTASYVWGNIAAVELRQGKVAEGKANLKKALEIDGKNLLASTMLSQIVPALEQGTLEPEALGQLQTAMEELALGDPREAGELLESVIRSSPRFPVAYQLLAQGLKSQHRYDQCEDLLRTAEQHLPNDVDIRLSRIECGLLRYGVASAKAKPLIAELKQVRDRDPNNVRALKLLDAIDER